MKKPGDAHSIAETELQKAMSNASIGSQALHKHMILFETEKLTDLKRILADFVSVEMTFHAKAIEHYSQCFESLAMGDEEMDLEEFTRQLNLPRDLVPVMLPLETDLPLVTVTSMSSTNMPSTLGSSSEYTSTRGSFTNTYGDSMISSGGKRVCIQDTGKSMYVDDDVDDDNDEDDDDNYGYSRPIRR